MPDFSRGPMLRRGATMQSFAIILLSVAAAIGYGIVHDQVTARICVEYFTIGHPPVFDTDSPTLLGLGWGVIATWWVGLLLGLPLAMVARMGRKPALSCGQLVRPILTLLLTMAAAAFLAGVVGYVLAARHVIKLLEPLASQVPAGHHAGFLIDVFAHLASYGTGLIGGIVLIVRAWRRRRTLEAGSVPVPQSA